MKRRTLKFAVCAAIMTLTLSMTACGKDDAADTIVTEDAAPEVGGDETEAETETPVEDESAEVEDDTETETEDEDDADAEAEDASGFTTLEDYYNDPTVKSALDSAFEAMATDGMSVACEVKGNEFTVIIKIEDSSMLVDGIGDALSAALDAQEDTFKAQVKQFDDVIGADGVCTVVMRYTDPDDNVLAEKAFTAN